VRGWVVALLCFLGLWWDTTLTYLS
jgi:hypothetical protein